METLSGEPDRPVSVSLAALNTLKGATAATNGASHDET